MTTAMMMISANDDDNDWLSLQSKMSSILSTQKSQSTTLNSYLTTTAQSHLATLSTHHDRLTSTSSQIQFQLQQTIQSETSALQRDNESLASQLSTIQKLTSKKDELLHTNSSLSTKLAQSNENIQKYQQELQLTKGDIDAIELEHCKSIPKIKRELTLHAMMTNIKWDYNHDNAVVAASAAANGNSNYSGGGGGELKGEVSLVDKGVLREFRVEKDCVGGECEVADRLWNIIEGV